MDFRTILASSKHPLSDYAQFAADGIDHICNNFGPRKCGGEAERKTQEYLLETLRPFADSVTREAFDVHPDAFMAFVPIAGGLLLASTAANIAGALQKRHRGTEGRGTRRKRLFHRGGFHQRCPERRPARA